MDILRGEEKRCNQLLRILHSDGCLYKPPRDYFVPMLYHASHPTGCHTREARDTPSERKTHHLRDHQEPAHRLSSISPKCNHRRSCGSMTGKSTVISSKVIASRLLEMATQRKTKPITGGIYGQLWGIFFKRTLSREAHERGHSMNT